MSEARVYLSPPDVGASEREALLRALDSGWIAPVGPELDWFEEELARTCQRRSACGLSSGTAALHLALELVGVGPGDEVFVSTLTFVASANPVRYVGATPVFIDCSRESWNVDPELLEAEFSQRARRGRLPKAAVIADMYGHCADYTRIEATCKRYEVALIEDAAESLGATHAGRAAGSFGRLAIASFNGNKIITTSGGGALLGDDPEELARARKLASQAREPCSHYEHREQGYNYRLSNLLAALGRAQLATLSDKVDRRREIFSAYERELTQIDGLSFLEAPAPDRGTNWLSVVLVDEDRFGMSAEALRVCLEEHNIESRRVWKPLHAQPLYREAPRVGGGHAESLFERGLCLPSGSGMNERQQRRVIDAIGGGHTRPTRQR